MSSAEVAGTTCISPAECRGADLLHRLIHKCDGEPKVLILSLGSHRGAAMPPRMIEKWAKENRFTYEMYLSNPYDQDVAAKDQQMGNACAGKCGYAVTWHHNYCCKACARTPGEHGPKCDRQALPEKVTNVAKCTLNCDDDNAGYLGTIARFIDQYKEESHKVVIFYQGPGDTRGCWKGGVTPEQVKHLAAGGNITVVTGSCYGGQWLKHFDGITATAADDKIHGDGKGGQFWYWLFNGDDFPRIGAPHCRGFLIRPHCVKHSEQEMHGKSHYDYTTAIEDAADNAERDQLERMQGHQLRMRELKRKAYQENGYDEQGKLVEGKYAPNAKLTQAALDEDEFAKMIPSSSASFHKALRVLEPDDDERHQPTAGDTSAEEDLSVYGDLFSSEGVHETSGHASEDVCVTIDVQEGVAIQHPGLRAQIFDSVFGGTRFDKSGRQALQQRPMKKGDRPHTFLRRPALRSSTQDFWTLEKLLAKGIPMDVLQKYGWDQEGHLKNQMKPRGWWMQMNFQEQRTRMASYDMLSSRKEKIPMPAFMTGVLAAQGRKRKHDECERTSANPAVPDDIQAKRRRGTKGQFVDHDAFRNICTGSKVKFAGDA